MATIRTPSEITLNYIRTNFTYNPTTGIVFGTYGNPIGSLTKNGYIIIIRWAQGFGILAHHIAWYLHYNCWPIKQLDHINRIKTDNRIKNLREASFQEQAFNTTRSLNRSLPKGISLSGDKTRYVAWKTIKGKNTYLGRHLTIKAAVQAYETEIFRRVL